VGYGKGISEVNATIGAIMFAWTSDNNTCIRATDFFPYRTDNLWDPAFFAYQEVGDEK